MSYFVRRGDLNGIPMHVLVELRQYYGSDGTVHAQEIVRAAGVGATDEDAAIALMQDARAMMIAVTNNGIDAQNRVSRVINKELADKAAAEAGAEAANPTDGPALPPIPKRKAKKQEPN